MVTPYVFGGALLVAAACLGPVWGRLSGARERALGSGGLPREAVRAGASAAALVVVVGDTRGDLVVVAALAVIAVGLRPPTIAVSLAAISAVAALRVGSSSLVDVTGAHTVLGPALLSPQWEVATPSALALAGGLVAMLALTPAAVSWRELLASPANIADTLNPVLAALMVLVVTVGPPVSDAPDATTWIAVRSALLVGSLPVVALSRRLVTADERTLGVVAAALTGTALAVALVAAA